MVVRIRKGDTAELLSVDAERGEIYLRVSGMDYEAAASVACTQGDRAEDFFLRPAINTAHLQVGPRGSLSIHKI